MNNIKTFIKNNKTVLITLFCFSILVFGYAGFNSIINLDGIDDFIITNKVSGYDLYLSVGRWGWSIIGFIFDYYPSPFLCLILNSALFALSGVYLGKILKINKKIYTILLSMIMIAFPINIIAYTYLPWQFSIGIGYFVSIYAVYRITQYKKIKDAIIPALLIAFATGIYQTYLPLIIVLSIISIIIYLDKKSKIKDFFSNVLRFIIIGAAGVLIYYIIVKLSTWIFNIEMNTYQSANTMFNLDFNTISVFFKYTLSSCFGNDYGYFMPKIIQISLVALLISGIFSYVFSINLRHSFLYTISIVILILAPKTLNFIKPFVFYHKITLLPYSILLSAGLVFLVKGIDVIKKKNVNSIANKIVIGVLVIIITSLTVNANKALIMSRQVTEASFHYLNRIQTKIEMLEGYDKLPNPKKYLLYRNYSNRNIFPFSENAYVHEQGITWTFMEQNSDTIPAFNMLGENVVQAELTNDELEEVYDEIDKRKSYPNDEGIFIYKDIVVVIMNT